MRSPPGLGFNSPSGNSDPTSSRCKLWPPSLQPHGPLRSAKPPSHRQDDLGPQGWRGLLGVRRGGAEPRVRGIGQGRTRLLTPQNRSRIQGLMWPHQLLAPSICPPLVNYSTEYINLNSIKANKYHEVISDLDLKKGNKMVTVISNYMKC